MKQDEFRNGRKVLGITYISEDRLVRENVALTYVESMEFYIGKDRVPWVKITYIEGKNRFYNTTLLLSIDLDSES